MEDMMTDTSDEDGRLLRKLSTATKNLLQEAETMRRTRRSSTRWLTPIAEQSMRALKQPTVSRATRTRDQTAAASAMDATEFADSLHSTSMILDIDIDGGIPSSQLQPKDDSDARARAQSSAPPVALPGVDDHITSERGTVSLEDEAPPRAAYPNHSHPQTAVEAVERKQMAYDVAGDDAGASPPVR
jgi:hypothetical protein